MDGDQDGRRHFHPREAMEARTMSENVGENMKRDVEQACEQECERAHEQDHAHAREPAHPREDANEHEQTWAWSTAVAARMRETTLIAAKITWQTSR